MQTHFLFDLLSGYAPYEQMVEESRKPGAVIAASGFAGAQKAHIACALAMETGRPLLFLCDSEKSATQTMEDVSALMGGGVCSFPAREITFYQEVAASREITCRRIETLQKLSRGECRAVIAPADALLHRVMPRAAFSAHTVRIRVGEVLPTDELCERLLGAGYTREYMVEGKGQFSVRGGIVDIYPSDSLTAVRVEFFDDEVDSIRLFDVMSQRSTQNLQEIAIPPASEAPAPHGREEAVADLLLQLMEKQKKAYARAHEDDKPEGSLADLPLEEGEIAVPEAFTRQSRAMERFEENIRQAADQLRRGVSNRMLEKFIHLIYMQTETLLDYMNRPIIVLDEPEALYARMDSRSGEFDQAFKSALERGDALSGQSSLMLTREEALGEMKRHTLLAMTSILRPVKELNPTCLCQMGGMGAGSYGGRTKDMVDDVRRWMQDGWRVVILSGGSARGERMRASFSDEGIVTAFDELGAKPPRAGECRIYPMMLSDGFQYPQQKVAVIVEGDVYGAKGKAKKKKKEGSKIASFTDLNVGDYVVHETHGIGIYQGTKRLVSEGAGVNNNRSTQTAHSTIVCIAITCRYLKISTCFQ